MIRTFTKPLCFHLDTSGPLTWNGSTVPDMILGNLGSLPGCGSKIFISATSPYHRGLLQSFTGEYDLIQHQYCSFKLAVTLVHELTHAAVYAATTDAVDKYQYFLGPQGKTTEMGFELEAWLFGGVYPEQMFESDPPNYYQYAETGKFSRLTSMITVNEYPCPLSLAGYASTGIPQVVKFECFRSTALFWNTSFLHIHQMFHDRFWKEIVPSHGRRALFFDRQTGLQCKLGPLNLLVPLDQYAVQILEIPDGFDVDRRGLIRRQVAEKKDEWSVFCDNLADKLTAELQKMG
ncbi:hypothetical protein PRZ48_014739 [Zasmidium cellare]|uniref:SprT-like domain-containing protein n=1 Tax=Zasmidium cellare TaxID=395010 RepID=A0ABR0DZR9_ZASCE|nr:hypothetical protein PRZ48_014739 [Zasmidium cellare]